MKITDSSLNLQSRYNYTEIYERKESLTLVDKQAEKDQKKIAGDRYQHTKDGETPPGLRKGHLKNGKIVSESELIKEFTEQSISDMKMRIMKMVLEEFTGKKFDIYDQSEEDENEESETKIDTPWLEQEAVVQEGGREQEFHYQLEEMRYENESLSFQAVGQVTTADGRSIAFSTSLHQNRELYEESRTEMSGTFVDPLVINHDGRGVKLSAEKVDFDLTGDGTKESISNLRTGSSFLALDRNGDGIINDGTELFGPTSGNGYAELRELDSDSNGWIDENDELFYDLKLWRPNGETTTLLERNVGAISVDSVAGSFQLKDSSDTTQGMIREQGIWLNETTGQAGMVQEIDLLA